MFNFVIEGVGKEGGDETREIVSPDIELEVFHFVSGLIHTPTQCQECCPVYTFFFVFPFSFYSNPHSLL